MCVLLVTWRANGIVLYMYEGKVLMDFYYYCGRTYTRFIGLTPGMFVKIQASRRIIENAEQGSRSVAFKVVRFFVGF